jgi:hypothetical protein
MPSNGSEGVVAVYHLVRALIVCAIPLGAFVLFLRWTGRLNEKEEGER